VAECNSVFPAIVKLPNVRRTLPIAAFGFDAALMMEDIFVTDSVYYFLWEFTRPLLQSISKVSNIRSNVAVLYNVSVSETFFLCVPR